FFFKEVVVPNNSNVLKVCLQSETYNKTITESLEFKKTFSSQLLQLLESNKISRSNAQNLEKQLAECSTRLNSSLESNHILFRKAQEAEARSESLVRELKREQE